MSAYEEGHTDGEVKAWEDVLYLLNESDPSSPVSFRDMVEEELTARGLL